MYSGHDRWLLWRCFHFSFVLGTRSCNETFILDGKGAELNDSGERSRESSLRLHREVKILRMMAFWVKRVDFTLAVTERARLRIVRGMGKSQGMRLILP